MAALRRSAVTAALIAADVAAYFRPGSPLRFGLVPARFASDPGGEWPALLASLFVHAGPVHLAGNLAFLAFFGPRVEARVGHVWFLTSYLAGGALAGAVQVAGAPDDPRPIVGASGAIAVAMGAWLLLAPTARTGRVPAWIWVGLWFVFQLLVWAGHRGRVAAGAHAAGFLAGIVLARVWLAFRHAPAGGPRRRARGRARASGATPRAGSGPPAAGAAGPAPSADPSRPRGPRARCPARPG